MSFQERPYEPLGWLSPDRRELLLLMPQARLVFIDLAGARVRFQACLRREGSDPNPKVETISWSPNGARLAVGWSGGAVQILDSASLEVDLALPVSAARPWVQWTADDGLLLIYRRAPAELWSVDRAERLAVLSTRAGPTSILALSEDRTTLALGDEIGDVTLWRTETGELLERVPAHGAAIRALALDPRGARLAIGAKQGSVRVWSVECREELVRLSYPGDDPFGEVETRGLLFSPDGRRLVATSSSFWDVRLWSVDDGREHWRHISPEGWPPGIGATFSENGALVLLSAYGLALDARTGERLQVLPPDGERSKRVRWERDLAWRYVDGRLQVFSLADEGRLLLDLPIDLLDD